MFTKNVYVYNMYIRMYTYVCIIEYADMINHGYETVQLE